MRHIVMGLLAIIALSTATAYAGEVSKDATERVHQAVLRAEQLDGGKVGEYAREYLEAAKLSIFMAQAAAASGNEKLASQHEEMAQLRMTVAVAKASEKEASEEVALNRAEFKKLEAQLERYMQPEEK